MRSVLIGAASTTRSSRGPPPSCRPPARGAPRPAARRCARSPRGLVLVVEVPPLVRRRLRIALWRVLPLLLAPERRHVEIRPGAAHRLVAALVDEVGAEDPL